MVFFGPEGVGKREMLIKEKVVHSKQQQLQHCFKGWGRCSALMSLMQKEALTSDLFQGRLQQIQPHLRGAERYFRVKAVHEKIG